MGRVLMLLGIAALIASPASASLNPDPKPIPRPQPAPPAPAFQRVAPAPVTVVHPTSAERAAATRRAARAQAAHLARVRAARAQARAQAARAKAARDAARKQGIEARRRAQLRREAMVFPPKAEAAVRDPLVPVLLGCAIAFLILAASPASAIPWLGAARVLAARRQVLALCGAAGLVAAFVVMVL